MSKFHVGDKVRLHPDDKLLEQFSLMANDLEGVWEVESFTEERPNFYDYDGVVYTVEQKSEFWDVPEEWLRPAKIVALSENVAESIARVISGDLSDTVPYARPVDVTNPAHYRRFPVEVIEITEQLDFNKGNAVKYLCRAGYKDGVDEMEDLSKALWYVNRAIEKLSKERADG